MPMRMSANLAGCVATNSIPFGIDTAGTLRYAPASDSRALASQCAPEGSPLEEAVSVCTAVQRAHCARLCRPRVRGVRGGRRGALAVCRGRQPLAVRRQHPPRGRVRPGLCGLGACLHVSGVRGRTTGGSASLPERQACGGCRGSHGAAPPGWSLPISGTSETSDARTDDVLCSEFCRGKGFAGQWDAATECGRGHVHLFRPPGP